MRAAVIDRHGPPQCITLRELPVPTPGPDEVLVRVAFGSVNHVDTFVRSGAWRTPLAFPFVVGRDAVGTVVEAGDAAAAEFRAGDEVWTSSLGYDGRDGALAELVRVPRARLYRCPAGLPASELVALAHPASTAWLALFRHGHLRAGMRVLVVGGGGNVGWSAVHLAVAAGAVVVTTCGTDDAFDLDRAGATPVDRAARLDRSTLGGAVDLVVDTAGRNDLEAYLDVLAPGGRVVLLAGMATRASFPVGALYLNAATVTGFAISQASVEDLALAARHVVDAVERTGLRPRRLSSVPLELVAAAPARLERGEGRGKVVVAVAAHHPPAPRTTPAEGARAVPT